MWLGACYVATGEGGGGGGGGMGRQLGITKDNVELREGMVRYVREGRDQKNIGGTLVMTRRQVPDIMFTL